jgi:hypothetical protein
MEQSLWESEVAAEQETEQPEPLQESERFEESEPQARQARIEREPEPEPADQAQTAEPEVLALNVDDFSALEERVLRAVDLVKRERQARAEAEQRAAKAEERLREQEPLTDRLQTEVYALQSERDRVRQRVERLLAQLDALEL